MKKYHYTYTPDATFHPPLPPHTLFLDIETTGFQRKSTYLTIIGVAWQEEGDIVIEQWFNEKGALGEPILLMELEKMLCQMDFPVLVHYNGTTFDLPYLKAKYEQFHLPTSIDECNFIDLYKTAKKYKQFLSLTGLKQKNLEEAFGLYREDSLSGRELIDAYLDGLHYNDQALLDLYLLHNKEDMEGMVFLQNLLKLDAFLEGDFSIVSWEYNAEHTCLSVTLTGNFYIKELLNVSYEGISISFSSENSFQPKRKAVCSKDTTNKVIVLSKEKEQNTPCHDKRTHSQLGNGVVEFTISLVQGEKKYFYDNYKDYYYLPGEDRAIHKSVAAFVEKEHREKAKKETCYIKKTASFLPLPLPEQSRLRKNVLKECCDLTLFYDSYGSQMAYISDEKDLSSRQKKTYLTMLLRSIVKK